MIMPPIHERVPHSYISNYVRGKLQAISKIRVRRGRVTESLPIKSPEYKASSNEFKAYECATIIN